MSILLTVTYTPTEREREREGERDRETDTPGKLGAGESKVRVTSPTLRLLERKKESPISGHESCTACIVGVARRTL